MVFIREGGSIEHARIFVPTTTGGSETAISISTLIDFAVNDYVELIVWQSSGGALDVSALPNRSPEFWIQRMD